MTSTVYNASILAKSATESTAKEFVELVGKAKVQLSKESGSLGRLQIIGKLVEVPAAGEAIVIGDLHGDLQSLVYILNESRFLSKVREKENLTLVFLGDYGDRGSKSPEVYYVVLTLKLRFPENVILLRGNHEGPPDLLAYPHDLQIRLKSKFGATGFQAYTAVRALFNDLYTATIIKGAYVLLHGGVPSQATTINDIAYAHRTHPKTQHLEEILWNDPWNQIKGTIASPRGAGRLFGEDITRKFLGMLNVSALIRSHQCCQNGYKSIHQNTVLTIFSTKSPPYTNKFGAYLHLNLSKRVKTPVQLIKNVHTF